jgi:uncharacterized protein
MNQSSRRGLLAGASAGALVLAAPATAGAAGPTTRHTARERRNRKVVHDAFAQQNAGGSFFDGLDDDVVWTIVNGSTYRSRAAFLEQGVAPVQDRLHTSLHMTVIDLWLDGDTVIVRFQADATALDGQPYHNDFCWVLTVDGSRVTTGYAFLDTVALTELIERVELPG